MNDEELDIPKGSILKQLNEEDLTVHSVEALNDRVAVLKAEILRTESEIQNKKNAYADADSFFK
ncbi:DUF1192 domain-containing protein [Pseudemcibacter aquimaris]|uniref:DUF1192 domain-containing protein n=1 Tax=Pseudemcibacter aquimaris TaxID=2857064 RepID=UPI0020129BA6|nr:DUF1192 domain-containing protein [Pseudemcibacter aquimaris]MCC3860047.1 DUF1192 domain-containing protein [Pseudemcibacter aquimaris]WDU57377.1 DUF1192 domain-containing protein [Pseudemcibacter aquimaris]